MFNVKRSIIGLLATGLFTMASASSASADPFKIVRVATNANGSIFVGLGIAPGGNSNIFSNQGVTVSHSSPGHYRVDFAPGTWSGCFFVPLVQSVFTTSPAEITAWATFGDGHGFVDIAIASGADAPLMMVFTSAAC
jgi:hypothetical protein